MEASVDPYPRGPVWMPITPKTGSLFHADSHAEAAAYLEHDLLGPRLVECTRLVMAASENSITDILGSPDDMKFRSCMTLFDAISRREIFAEAIAAFYPDGKDRATLEILKKLTHS
jgi:uncharacterized protein (DUF1810 family)